MIDAIGGVELCLDGRLVDPKFDGSLTNDETNEGLVLEPGCRLYDGITALAYARSRKGYIEMPDGERVQQTDFDRAERQQRVLLAMRKELTEADTFLELPQLLRRHRPHRQHRLPARPGRRLREPPAAHRRAGHRARRARLSRVRRPARSSRRSTTCSSRSATPSGRRWRGSSASTSSRAGTWDRPRPVRPATRPPGRRRPSGRRRAGPRSPRGRPRRR